MSIRRIVLPAICLATLSLTEPAMAASITLEPGIDRLPATIRISGKIELGDERRFAALATRTEDAVVRLDSSGGMTHPALAIGRMIHAMQFTTLVEQARCTSSCALIWLAGVPRILGRGARVGFHATYETKGSRHEITARGNAEVGAYIRSLGLPGAVIAFATDAKPEEMNWLSRPAADAIGLPVARAEADGRVRALHNSALGSRWATPPDLPSAMTDYRAAAESGFAGSQNNLGDMYETGTGTRQNPLYAIYWYTRAAERGEPTAYLSLSTLLPDATADRAVLMDALKFALLAERHLKPGRNQDAARSNVELLSGRLSADEVAQARGAAADWEPLYQERWLIGDRPAVRTP